MAMVASLKDMGFTDGQIQAGLKATGSKEIETVTNWILNNPDVTAEADSGGGGQTLGATGGNVLGSASGAAAAVNDESAADASAAQSVEVARSLKCEDCGRLLKSAIDAEAHAAKTGHSNFAESTEEIKPLTEEEKKKKLEELQEKMKERRMQREQEEKKEAIEKEKHRRKEGQNLGNIKDDFERKEMMKAAEQRRREKEEDRLAREKVKADIARDRANKRAAADGGSANISTVVTPQTSSVQQQPTATTTATGANGTTAPKTAADYKETRIQIRFRGAPPKVQKFSSSETLAAVRLFVQLNSPVPLHPNFSLMTSFPKKVFSSDDLERPLFDLGLVPSAVLDIQQPN